MSVKKPYEQLEQENKELKALLRELAVRTNRVFPETVEEIQQFNNKTDIGKPGVKAFSKRLFKAISKRH